MLTVLLPTYEPDPRHLQEALDGLLAQTHADWTCVINDDASTADVHGMLKPYLADSRFTFHRNDRRLGIGGNWNACLDALRNSQLSIINYQFSAFLFQDDHWCPDYLATAIEQLTRYPTAAFASLGHRYDCEAGTPEAYYQMVESKRNALAPGLHDGKRFLRRWMRTLLRPNLIGEPSFTVIRRDALDRAGPFQETMPQLLDVEMWTRLLRQGDWLWIPGDFGTFRVHAGGASETNRKTWNVKTDRLRILWRGAVNCI